MFRILISVSLVLLLSIPGSLGQGSGGDRALLLGAAQDLRKYRARHGVWPPTLIRAGLSRAQVFREGNGKLEVRLVYSLEQAVVAGRAPEALGFDPLQHAVVRMPEIRRPGSRIVNRRLPDGKGGWRTYQIRAAAKGERVHVLGVLIDGTIRWVPILEDWERRIPRSATSTSPPPGSIRK